MDTCPLCGTATDPSLPEASANMPVHVLRERLRGLEASLERSRREGLGLDGLGGGRRVCWLCSSYLPAAVSSASALQSSLLQALEQLRQRLDLLQDDESFDLRPEGSQPR